jgi:hypothetical protein
MYVLGGDKMTESSKPTSVDLEADARERQAVADSLEVQPLQKRIITIEDLHQHVLDLAADLEIKWTNWRAEADTETRTIYLYPIKSERAYASALHEIGHIRNGRDDELTEERKAWEWARRNALVWTPTMQREADSCMRTYTTDVAHRAEYYYEEILAFLNDLYNGDSDGELVYDALVAHAVELAQAYEDYNSKEVRLVLIRLIDKHLAAYPQDLEARYKQARQEIQAKYGIVSSQSSAAEQ